MTEFLLFHLEVLHCCEGLCFLEIYTGGGLDRRGSSTSFNWANRFSLVVITMGKVLSLG